MANCEKWIANFANGYKSRYFVIALKAISLTTHDSRLTIHDSRNYSFITGNST